MLANPYFHQFATIAGLHLAAVVCPGPDFALVTRKAVLDGRMAGVYASVGIALAMAAHAFYALAAMHFFAEALAGHLATIRILGSIYLLYLGVAGLMKLDPKKGRPVVAFSPDDPPPASRATFGFWRNAAQGLLTNGLNPKAIIFVFTIFSAGTDPATPTLYLVYYGLWMCLVNLTWFSALSCILSQAWISHKLASHERSIALGTSCVFMAAALSLLSKNLLT